MEESVVVLTAVYQYLRGWYECQWALLLTLLRHTCRHTQWVI